MRFAADERYAQTDEFLTIWRRILSGEPADFEDKYLPAHGTDISLPPIQRPHPPLWFGGSSDAGIEVAAKHIDVYLSWGEPVEQVKENFDRVRAQATAQRRTVRFGLRINLIVRGTEEEAWAAADCLISRVTDDLVAEAQHQFTNVSESVGQKQITALHQDGRDNLVIAPNLWARSGSGWAGTALVGNLENVAARIPNIRRSASRQSSHRAIRIWRRHST